MPSKEDAGLITAAAKLAKAQPVLWQAFINELDRYAGRTLHGMISVQTRVEFWQGRAAEAASISHVLETAPDEARKLGEYSK